MIDSVTLWQSEETSNFSEESAQQLTDYLYQKAASFTIDQVMEKLVPPTH